MIRNGDRPSQSLRAKTRGLDSNIGLFSCHSNPRPDTWGAAAGTGRPTLKESQTTLTRDHRRPIASIIHMQFSQDKPDPTNVEKRQVCTTWHPMDFPTSSQEGGFVQDLAKPRKISQYLSPSRRKHARYRTKTHGALTKSNGPR